MIGLTRKLMRLLRGRTALTLVPCNLCDPARAESLYNLKMQDTGKMIVSCVLIFDNNILIIRLNKIDFMYCDSYLYALMYIGDLCVIANN